MAAPVTFTILGSGTSHGVPVVACSCAVCKSTDPRDKRNRSALLVEDGTTTFCVDTPPEFRLQCLAFGIEKVEAVLYTHSHADHVLGFDDLRRFSEKYGLRLPVHASPETLAALRSIYPYAFDETIQIPTYLQVTGRPFPPAGESFPLGTLTVTPVPVVHGKAVTHGFLFEREGRKLLAYVPDVKEIPAATAERIEGVETLVIDGLRDEPHPTHLTIQEAVAAGRALRAGTTFLTHLTHHKSHADREAELPPGFGVAYDGLKLIIS